LGDLFDLFVICFSPNLSHFFFTSLCISESLFYGSNKNFTDFNFMLCFGSLSGGILRLVGLHRSTMAKSMGGLLSLLMSLIKIEYAPHFYLIHFFSVDSSVPFCLVLFLMSPEAKEYFF